MIATIADLRKLKERIAEPTKSGTRKCACGRTISANKPQCKACADKAEAPE